MRVEERSPVSFGEKWGKGTSEEEERQESSAAVGPRLN